MNTELDRNKKINEETYETSIRPSILSEYVGQSEVKENLEIFIKAAKLREETLEELYAQIIS